MDFKQSALHRLLNNGSNSASIHSNGRFRDKQRISHNCEGGKAERI